MNNRAQDLVEMFNLLPESEQDLAYEMVKRLVLAWDSDYTKLTPVERARLEESTQDLKRGEVTNYADIDWN
ncbi:hypothetical protein MHB44_11555 [Lysinibacillus sp. FSL H8-0500]|uniref:hypothetical protein n=1 Tax=Lysinibacillus sp. FSL H8-0500 TaxID=2921393 RepID=UPI003100BAD6